MKSAKSLQIHSHNIFFWVIKQGILCLLTIHLHGTAFSESKIGAL